MKSGARVRATTSRDRLAVVDPAQVEHDKVRFPDLADLLARLRFSTSDIGIEQIIKQTALVGAQLLAALGELVSLEDGDFMSQLLVDRFEALDFLAHGVDLGQQLHSLFGQAAQLFRCHLVEIGRGSHAADCVRAGRQQR